MLIIPVQYSSSRSSLEGISQWLVSLQQIEQWVWLKCREVVDPLCRLTHLSGVLLQSRPGHVWCEFTDQHVDGAIVDSFSGVLYVKEKHILQSNLPQLDVYLLHLGVELSRPTYMNLDSVIEVQLVVNNVVFIIFAAENIMTCVNRWDNVYYNYFLLIMACRIVWFMSSFHKEIQCLAHAFYHN